MIQTLRSRSLLPFLFPIIILLSSIVFSFSTLFKSNPAIAIGVTYDLTLLMPLAYLMAIWRKRIPKITVVPFFVLGVIISSFLIPEHLQWHLMGIKNYLLPVIELGIVSFIVFNIYKGVKAFKANVGAGETDVLRIIQHASLNVLKSPKIATVFTSEIAMVYYSFLCWKKGAKTQENTFTNYKKSGMIALFLTVLFVMIIETTILHMLLISWNAIVTWILTLSSVYAGIQLFGHTQALRLRPHFMGNQQLHLRYGLFGDISININDIERIEMNRKPIQDEDKLVEKLALFKDFEGHNVVIYFNTRQTIKKVYGLTKPCDIIQLYVDEAVPFIQTVSNRMTGRIN